MGTLLILTQPWGWQGAHAGRPSTACAEQSFFPASTLPSKPGGQQLGSKFTPIKNRSGVLGTTGSMCPIQTTRLRALGLKLLHPLVFQEDLQVSI